MKKNASAAPRIVGCNISDPPLTRLCEKFVVRPSGGSLYPALRPNYELPPEGRTTNMRFHTVSDEVGIRQTEELVGYRLALLAP